MNILALSDWCVFSLVLMATGMAVFLGHTLSKNTKNSVIADLGAGRALTMPMFVVTTISTLFGSFFGVTQFAFERGIYNLLTQGIFWYAAYLLAALLIVPRIRQSRVPQTLPDLLRENYGPISEKVGALFNFIDIVPITFAIGLGTCIRGITGWSHTVAMCSALSCVVVYSALARVRAAIFSDMLQMAVMYVGAFLVVAYSISNYGVATLLNDLPAKHWEIFPEDLSLTLMWAFFSLAALTDPSFYHRCFAAQSTRTAQRGIVVSTIFWFVFDLFTTIGGMYARAIIPNADPKEAYLTYALSVLPSPLGGLLLAGILATMLSAIDVYLFVGSTTLFKNLMPTRQRDKWWIKYVGMVLIGSLAAFLADRFDGSIYHIWKTLGSLSTSCFLAPLVLGLFSRRKIADSGFALACVLGIFSLTIWKYLPRTGVLADIDEFYIGLLGSLTGIAIAHVREMLSRPNKIVWENNDPRPSLYIPGRLHL